MDLTPEQIKKLRNPFDDVVALKGRSGEEVEKFLKKMMEIWPISRHLQEFGKKSKNQENKLLCGIV